MSYPSLKQALEYRVRVISRDLERLRGELIRNNVIPDLLDVSRENAGHLVRLLAGSRDSPRHFVGSSLSSATFVTSWPRVGGAIRVVVVEEPSGYVAFFSTDKAAIVVEILSTVDYRFPLETTFLDCKEIAGAGVRGADDGPRNKDRITMSDRPSHNLDDRGIDLARRIDEVCRRFVADWRAGRQSRIEDYLGEVPDEGHLAIPSELEALERELR